MSQLERNLQEDFSRDGVDEFAKGVLFGNAFRLAPPEDRGDFFSEKCMKAAKRCKVVARPDTRPFSGRPVPVRGYGRAVCGGVPAVDPRRGGRRGCVSSNPVVTAVRIPPVGRRWAPPPWYERPAVSSIELFFRERPAPLARGRSNHRVPPCARPCRGGRCSAKARRKQPTPGSGVWPSRLGDWARG